MLQPPPTSVAVHRLRPFLFLALLLPSVSSFKTAVFIGQVNQRDTNKPFYEVHVPHLGFYHSTKRPIHVTSAVTPMRMVSARGQVLTCMVPNPAPPEETPTVTDPAAVFDDIDDLFKDYEQKCYMRDEGWWSYEFCFGKHVIQKHIIGDRNAEDEVEDEFVLGLFDREADKLRRKNVSQVSTPDAAFTQLFTNGTVCDMTNKPRRVTVKYLCSEDAVQLSSTTSRKAANSQLNIFNAIRETESCVYEIEFINAAICHHASYRAKLARNSRPIHCSLEDGQQPFQGLATNTYPRSSLSL